MPKTKFQSFIFTFITALLMAYCMIVYSVAMHSPDGFTNQTFLTALQEFPLEAIIVFLLTFFVASPLAQKRAFCLMNPKKDKSIFVILTVQTFTILTMVALMSLYALFAQHLANANFACNYITLYCQNFLMAYPLQIFFVGPIARHAFRAIFKQKSN